MDEPRVGGRIHVSCTPLTDEEGRLLGAVHIMRPPGNGHRPPAPAPDGDLAETPAHRFPTPDLHRVLDAVSDQIVVLDRQLRILWLNEAVAAEADRPTAELRGRRCHEVLFGAEAPCLDCAVTVAFADGRTVESERRSADGRYLLHRAYPLVDSEGAVTAVVATAEDVTARRLTEVTLAESATELRTALQATVRALGAVIELRDPDTARHQRTVAHLAQALAAEMGLDDDLADGLWFTGHLHDIGKLCVPIEILGRPGRLGGSELTLVRLHPEVAERILADIPFERPVASAVGQHHERLDGSGYPRGLRGDQIALEARILAVADVVAAMTAHRPHRPALAIETVVKEIVRGTGTQFDPDVVAALRHLHERGELPIEG